jgi:hypothetical protein
VNTRIGMVNAWIGIVNTARGAVASRGIRHAAVGEEHLGRAPGHPERQHADGVALARGRQDASVRCPPHSGESLPDQPPARGRAV